MWLPGVKKPGGPFQPYQGNISKVKNMGRKERWHVWDNTTLGHVNVISLLQPSTKRDIIRITATDYNLHTLSLKIKAGSPAWSHYFTLAQRAHTSWRLGVWNKVSEKLLYAVAITAQSIVSKWLPLCFVTLKKSAINIFKCHKKRFVKGRMTSQPSLEAPDKWMQLSIALEDLSFSFL